MNVTVPPDAKDKILLASPGFGAWLYQYECSLAFTTYQAGRLFFLGTRADGSLWAHERFFEQAQGLWTDTQSVLLSTRDQLWHFRNVLPPETAHTPTGSDRLFSPRVSYVTGVLDIHDIAVDRSGVPVFVNTAYSCLATVSSQANFQPLWKPGFISKLAPEDRCHLNGLAMQDGVPRFVTAISRSDVADGWRERRGDGGVVLSVADDEVVAHGLSMPHSPRLYRNRLWLLNSGTGEFGYVDLDTGRFEPVCFCPGYARGLSFIGNFAIIGLSKPRPNHTFEGLELDDTLRVKDTEARCGLIVVSLDTGTTAHWVRFEDKIVELYDVAVLGGVRQPMAVGFKERDVIGGLITVGGWPERPAAAKTSSKSAAKPTARSATSGSRRKTPKSKRVASN